MTGQTVDMICPNCEQVFEQSLGFAWLPDADGDPTVEYMQCPFCLISTEPFMSCDGCPISGKCDQDEECKVCGVKVKLEDFDIVIDEQTQRKANQ
jgi:hypothetical protein